MLSSTPEEMRDGLDGCLDLIYKLKKNEKCVNEMFDFLEHTVRPHLKHNIPLPIPHDQEMSGVEYIYSVMHQIIHEQM